RACAGGTPLHVLPGEPLAKPLALLSSAWLLRLPSFLEGAEVPPACDQELGIGPSSASAKDAEERCELIIHGVTYDVSSFLEVLLAPAAALTETPPVPSSGQLDHFSYSLYLDDKAQEKRWRMPHLRLPQVRLGKTKGLTKAQAKTAMKAVPVLAAAAAEIPAVREQLRQWVGQDVAPHVLAQQTLWRAKSEAQRLGQQAADSARAASRQLQSMGHGIMNELKEVNKEVDETVIKAEHAAEELLHIKHEESSRGWRAPGFSPRWAVWRCWRGSATAAPGAPAASRAPEPRWRAAAAPRSCLSPRPSL
ncbi:unnamed protein product, partial [Effrenium voratum]